MQAEKDSPEHWRHLIAVCARGLHALGPSTRVAPEQIEELAAQLAAVQEAFENGRRVIRIPEVGGLHGDLATAYARAFWHARAADAQLDEPVNYYRGASEYAGVSTPLTWKEVDAGVDPRDFTIVTAPARFADVGDLWARLRTAKPANLEGVFKKYAG